MARVHPIELETAIGKAVISGTPTTEIYRQALSGELPGVRALPDLSRSTFFATLKRVRARLLEALAPSSQDGDSELITRLAREELKRETEPKPLPIPSEVSVPGPQSRPTTARRDALVKRLEAMLAESAG
jgi:hypothetical protein